LSGTRAQTLFCDALAEAYRSGAETGGHTVDVFATARMTFDPILHPGFESVQPLEADLQKALDAILVADHLVTVFPLWLGTLPAILKSFLERVLQPSLVGPSKQGKFGKVPARKSVHIFVTMGMPALLCRWWFGAHAVKLLEGNILAFMGVRPIRSTFRGSIESAGPLRRKQWLPQAETMGQGAT
jgi:NAD(P)H dehydrogenase (quinone)